MIFLILLQVFLLQVVKTNSFLNQVILLQYDGKVLLLSGNQCIKKVIIIVIFLLKNFQVFIRTFLKIVLHNIAGT